MRTPTGLVWTAAAVAAVTVLLAVAAALPATARSARQVQRFTIYAVATRAQYVNYSDGITRAKYQNPFNIDTKKFTPTTKGKTSTLPGNSAFFTFDLYSDSKLKKKLGTATLTCNFNFHGNATCDAYYELGESTLFGTGPVDFSTLRSTLAITGGTGKYAGSNGEVSSIGPGSKPAAKNESRFDFELLG